MPQKNFIKENFVLIVGLTLPILLMVGFMVASSLPQSVANPPKYDLVFDITQYPSVSGGIPVEVNFVVKDGVLKAQYTRVENADHTYPNTAWKKLYLYDAQTQKVRELTFGFPDGMEKITDTREDTVDATKNMKLDTTLQSPDGYELTTDTFSHYGLFTDIFGGGGSSSEPVLQKGGERVKLTSDDRNVTFTYSNPEFLGWVKGK